MCMEFMVWIERYLGHGSSSFQQFSLKCCSGRENFRHYSPFCTRNTEVDNDLLDIALGLSWHPATVVRIFISMHLNVSIAPFIQEKLCYLLPSPMTNVCCFIGRMLANNIIFSWQNERICVGIVRVSDINNFFPFSRFILLTSWTHSQNHLVIKFCI